MKILLLMLFMIASCTNYDNTAKFNKIDKTLEDIRKMNTDTSCKLILMKMIVEFNIKGSTDDKWDNVHSLCMKLFYKEIRK